MAKRLKSGGLECGNHAQGKRVLLWARSASCLLSRGKAFQCSADRHFGRLSQINASHSVCLYTRELLAEEDTKHWGCGDFVVPIFAYWFA